MSGITTSSVAIAALIDYLIGNGYSYDEIEQATGIKRVIMDDPHVRISLDQFLKIWEVAIQWTQNPALPLTLREKDTKLMHLVAHICMTSTDLFEAIDKWQRYAMLVCESDKILLRQENSIMTALVYENTSPLHQNIWIPEHHLALAFRYAEFFTGQSHPPVEVRFKHSPTTYLTVYEKVFRCPVKFNQAENALIGLTELFSTKISSTNMYLQTILSRHADSLLKDLTADQSVSQQVKKLIFMNLSNGNVDVESIANQMKMHPKTLYRKLKQEDTSFQALLELTRKKLAVGYLKQGVSATEITFLLGFSEPSGFQHAFKRWFGKSPKNFLTQNTELSNFKR
jgi:AraC-like DNA-binding protein